VGPIVFATSPIDNQTADDQAALPEESHERTVTR
jgi:hypothetical protein